MNRKLVVAVLFGGESVEHKVSCRSAATICKHLHLLGYTVIPIGISRDGRWSIQDYDISSDSYPSADFIASREVIPRPGSLLYEVGKHRPLVIDIAFPVTHGTGGEDGQLQGLLDLAHIPYVGCNSVASCTGMHKYLAKIVAKEAQVPTLGAIVIEKRRIELVQSAQDPYIEHLMIQISEQLGEHVIIKPEDGGSSVGIRVLHQLDAQSLLIALQEVSRFTPSIMIEPYLDHIQEIEVAVITEGDSIEASDPGLLINPLADQEIATYEQKYLSSHCAYMQIPAPLDTQLAHRVSTYAIDIAKAIGVEGYARVDFFYDPTDDSILFNEINTLPGMTSKSHFPLLAQSMGYDWPRLLRVLIDEGLAAYARRNNRETIAVE